MGKGVATIDSLGRGGSLVRQELCNIVQATKSYEAWKRGYGLVVATELRDKHEKMKEDPFQFLRSTYHRWAQLWPQICAEAWRAPQVLSVGDLHVDSFGTWRDEEGRLCWGVDDFDESWPLPYSNDLTRLAASTRIATRWEYCAFQSNWRAR
jgi:uncharacterized protein (DUF2252 family)